MKKMKKCFTSEDTWSNWGTSNRKSNPWTCNNENGNHNWSKSTHEVSFSNRDSSSRKNSEIENVRK